jgi:DNA-binding transcriptional ArsR family regulator
VAKRSAGSAAVKVVRGEAASAKATSSTGLSSVDGDMAGPLALDRVIHERIRLAIVSTLAVHEMLTFTELRSVLETSDGNLSVHARKLEDAGYVSCKKSFDGRIPRTEYRITAAGRRALEQYLSHMEALIRRVGG